MNEFNKLADMIIGVSLDICNNYEGGNSGTTYYMNYEEDFISIDFNDEEEFESKLYDIIISDKRVIQCEIGSMGEDDVNIVFVNDVLKNWEE